MQTRRSRHVEILSLRCLVNQNERKSARTSPDSSLGALESLKHAIASNRKPNHDQQKLRVMNPPMQGTGPPRSDAAGVGIGMLMGDLFPYSKIEKSARFCFMLFDRYEIVT